MSTQALAGYLDVLVSLRGLSVKEVTRRAGVRQEYISRLGRGGITSPGAETVGRLVDAVGGNIETAIRLLMNEEATEQDGRRAAQYEALENDKVMEIAQLVHGVNPERRQEFFDKLHELRKEYG